MCADYVMQSPPASDCRTLKEVHQDETMATLEGSICRLDEVRRKLLSEVAVIQGLTMQCSQRNRSAETEDLLQRVRDNLSEMSLTAIKGATGVGQHIDSEMFRRDAGLRRTQSAVLEMEEKPCRRKNVLQRLKLLRRRMLRLSWRPPEPLDLRTTPLPAPPTPPGPVTVKDSPLGQRSTPLFPYPSRLSLDSSPLKSLPSDIVVVNDDGEDNSMPPRNLSDNLSDHLSWVPPPVAPAKSPKTVARRTELRDAAKVLNIITVSLSTQSTHQSWHAATNACDEAANK